MRAKQSKYPKLRPSTPEDYITIPLHERKYISFQGSSTGDYTEVRIEFGFDPKEGFKETSYKEFEGKFMHGDLRGIMIHEFIRVLGLNYHDYRNKSIYYKITHHSKIFTNCLGMCYPEVVKEITFEEMRRIIDYKYCEIDLYPMLEHYKEIHLNHYKKEIGNE